MLYFDENRGINIIQADLYRGVTLGRVVRLKQSLTDAFSKQHITIPLDILRAIIILSNSTIHCPVHNTDQSHPLPRSNQDTISQHTDDKQGDVETSPQDNPTPISEFTAALETIHQDYIKTLGF